MKLQKERQLLVFLYIDQKGLTSLDHFRSEIKMQEDPEFNFDSVVNDFIKEGYVEQIDDQSWNITSWGNIEFSDLSLEKIEELNKKAYIIRAIVILLFIIAFMAIQKFGPLLLQWWTEYNSHFGMPGLKQ